jgi:hypothetical protein
MIYGGMQGWHSLWVTGLLFNAGIGKQHGALELTLSLVE